MQKLWVGKELGGFKDKKECEKNFLAKAGVRSTCRGLVGEGKAFAFYSKLTEELFEGFK